MMELAKESRSKFTYARSCEDDGAVSHTLVLKKSHRLGELRTTVVQVRCYGEELELRVDRIH